MNLMKAYRTGVKQLRTHDVEKVITSGKIKSIKKYCDLYNIFDDSLDVSDP